MKGKHLKSICFIVVTAVITVNSNFIVLAKENNEQKYKEPQIQNEAVSEKNMDSDECYGFEHFKNTAEAENDYKDQIKGKLDSTYDENENLKKYNLKANSNYTMKYLNTLDYKTLVETISNCNWYEIEGLFQFTDDSYEFYKDKNRMEALINALGEKGKIYTATDDKGIPTIVEVLRSGFYLGYYNKPLNELYELSYRQKCIPSMLEIQKNSNFKLGESGQNETIKSLGMLIGNTTCNEEIVNNFTKIIKQYNENRNVYIKDISKSNAVFEVVKGVEYELSSYLYNNNGDISNAPWKNRIDKFIDEVSKFIKDENVTEENSWLINCGIYLTGKFAKFYSNPIEKQKEVENVLNVYPYLGEQYFKAIESIQYDFNGILSTGKTIDLEKIKEDGKKYYLPNTYTFEDGKMIIKTGDKVTKEKVERLYWASKEVRSQFHRVVGNDKELEQGNADDILTMVIYNSPKEYKMNSSLYGYSTDNGGIYIEGIGTFFTYERTVDDSIFSLEELFRHEYTHYLQGRYLVPGLWGRGDFYKEKDSRLTWFEEGTAEFFAGSTRENNILARKSQVSGLDSNPSNRFTAEKLFNSKYGSWEFYYYGFAFSDYMYNNRMDVFNKFIKTIKSNDVKGYDDYIATLSLDNDINNQYQSHMENLVKNYENLTTPLVSDDYLKNHSDINSKLIYSNIEKISNIKNTTVNEEKGQFFNTFTLRGTYIGEKSYGELEDWKKMNEKSNDFVKKLGGLEWSGYKTINCYFVNHRVNSQGQYEYDVIFTGILGDGNISNNPPTANIDGPNVCKVGETITLSSKNSTDSDGKIVEYFWDFGDGNTSNEVNPTHVYKKEGTFNIVLKVKDDKGALGEKVLTIKVEKKNIDEEDNIDLEPNNNFKEANLVPNLNKSYKGSLLGNDNVDVYCFKVENPDKLKIEVNNLDNIGMNWTLFNEENLNEFVAYPMDDKLNGEYEVTKPGMYYINIYKYDYEDGKYEFKISSEFSKNIIMESEPNNDFQKANMVELNKIINGNLSDDDNVDIFKFQLDEDKDINIVLNNMNNIGLNWLLYKEEDLDNYVSFAQIDNNIYKNSYKATKGKYYLYVYNFSKDNGKYTVEIN
ncbi:collagenase [Clostridium senegalense]|uniref:collagenase n=1 Tax=Clostridium senegalense TaxID=1465809 RepID=UPI0002890510|nr:collagenase [Clostridium senegalense]